MKYAGWIAPDKRITVKRAGSRGGRGDGDAAGWPTATAPIGRHPGGRSIASAATSWQNRVDEIHAEPRPSTASAMRRFCTEAPADTVNMSRSARERRSSGYEWAAEVSRHGTTISGALRRTSPRRTRRAICSSVKPSRRRSSTHELSMASSSRSRARADWSTTKRHGSLWCGAGAVNAVPIARLTAARSTASVVNERTVRRARGTSAEP